MTMTDPVADMLTRLRNANSAHHDSVSMPNSKLKAHIAEILKNEGYIAGFEVDRRSRRQDPHAAAQVRPEPRALDRGHQARLEARPPRLREVDRDPQGARRPRRRDPVHLQRSAHRPPGREEGRGWGSPRLRVVVPCHESDDSPSTSPPVSTSRSTARPSPSRAPRASSRSPSPAPIEVKVEDGQVLVTRPDDERDSRSLHGLTRTLIANQIIGVTEGYSKGLEVVGTGYRVAQKGCVGRVRARLLAPRHRRAAGRHHAHRRGQQQAHGRRHRQAGRRRGRRQHPQDPQARALQGQGRALRRRGRASQGRKDW